MLKPLEGDKAAAGAATGELIGSLIIEQLYPDVPKGQLNEEQKQTVSLLSTLAAGLAGGVVGDSSASAMTGAQAGKNAIENNGLSKGAKKVGEMALENCLKSAGCMNTMRSADIPIALTNSMIEDALTAGATRDPAKIAQLTPQQIEYLDEQIKSGAGMAGLILGSVTWGDRLNIPNDTSGNQIIDPGSNNTGGNQLPDQGATNTGGNQIAGGSATNTGGNQIADSLQSNTGGSQIVEPDWRENIYISENRKTVSDNWHSGSFDSSEDSLLKHFNKHGTEVGAADVEQYLLKAQYFANDLKGAKKVQISGATEGVTRYYKNGKYIDMTSDKKIISFGRQ
ncbi:VENN motif pre-toxin domain-containing protein [Limnobaculum xujianqingii]|uniref:VENN motif pre-toxin domain-containing protein n=1 Tax=Limnobaculum xujianqingii TaxID=2738837 RepID=UPI001129C285|nr:VENN motif pre-toxin domain-containing protein [Limnobaculum xujianqingii]